MATSPIHSSSFTRSFLHSPFSLHTGILEEARALIKETKSPLTAEAAESLLGKLNHIYCELSDLHQSEQQHLSQPTDEVKAHIQTIEHLIEVLKLKRMSFELFHRISPPSLPPLTQEVTENLQQGATYVDQEQLGQGAFGVVCKTELKTVQLAKKIVIPGKDASSDSFFSPKKLIREAALLMTLNHRNIVQIASLAMHPVTALIIKLANRGSLADNLARRDIYEKPNLMNILTSSAEGLKYLHDKELTHGDLHLRNIVLHQEAQNLIEPIIIDLELASSSSVSHETEGNFAIKPPEILACNDSLLYHTRKKLRFRVSGDCKTLAERRSIEKCQQYLRDRPITNKIDIWAFGILVFSLISGGKTPYQLNRISTKNSVYDELGSHNQLTKSLKFSSTDYLRTSLHPTRTKQPLTQLGLPHTDPLSIDLRDSLVSRCFQMDQQDRPSSVELVAILQEIELTESLRNLFQPIDPLEV